MIVVCTSCRARFRIADEKVGPKGVRVRCSKCKNAFVVAPAAGPQPPAAALASPTPMPSAPVPPPDNDGRAAPGESSVAEADPFAAFFAGSGAAAPVAEVEPAPSPEAAPPADGASAQPRFLAGLPVTNLADLEKTGAHRALPSELPPGEPPPPGPADDGLSLEERTPVGIPLSEPLASDPFATEDFPFPEPVRDPASDMPEPMPDPEPGFEFGATLPFEADAAGTTPSLAVEAEPPFDAPRVPPPLPAPAAAPAPAAPAAEAGREVRAPPGEEPAPVEADAFGGARLRGVFVNALSLALLLVFTAGILIWWRGESVLALVRRATRTAPAPLTAVASENGYFETSSGRLLVFVRGDVRSHRPVPVGRVRVRAEMVQAGRVVAKAEGLAGAVPTPEELAAVSSREDAEKLDSALALRAPKQIASGQEEPFLLTFVDYPPSMGDVTFRVSAELAPGP